jgi:hypothetical protein
MAPPRPIRVRLRTLGASRAHTGRDVSDGESGVSATIGDDGLALRVRTRGRRPTDSDDLTEITAVPLAGKIGAMQSGELRRARLAFSCSGETAQDFAVEGAFVHRSLDGTSWSVETPEGADETLSLTFVEVD